MASPPCWPRGWASCSRVMAARRRSPPPSPSLLPACSPSRRRGRRSGGAGAIQRPLISRKSNMIGIVMGDILNPFYPAVLNAFTQRLQLLGRHVLLFGVPDGRDVDDVLPQMLQYQVAGVVITSATLSSHMAKTLGESGTPVVLFHRTVYGNAVSSGCC